LFKDGRFQWQRLENMIRIAQSDQGFNLIPTAGLGLQFLLSDDGRYLRRQIILALTEDNRLHTEEVRRLWDLVKEDLTPDRVWDAAWAALADFSRERAAALVPSVGDLTAALQPK
ncbi:MAG: AarF/ABC1/UbiB kinase family protein, partial [Leptolyngbya sp. SIO4C1]|nr:AarF/ABC1/UbiB kinase family protein [Leptolyngbya sp. SIO4C1]